MKHDVDIDKISEKDVEKYFVRQCTKNKILQFKFTSPNRRGVPDRIIFLPGGRTVFVELKRPGVKATPLQSMHQRRFIDLGFDAYIIDNKADIDKLMDRLIP